jgi:hypothetical protein
VHRSNWKYGETREDGYIFVGWKRRGEKVTPDFRNPEAFERQKEYHKINKKKVYDAITALYNASKTKLGCSHCNKKFKKYPERLDYHHINPEKKEKSVSSFWRTSWQQFKKMKKEWEKCIVLCANCHRTEEKRIRNEN